MRFLTLCLLNLTVISFLSYEAYSQEIIPEIWSISLGNSTRLKASAIDNSAGYAYFGDEEGYFYKIDLESASVVWQIRVSSNSIGDFVIDSLGAFAYIGSYSSNVVMKIDLDSGSEYTTPWPIVLDNGQSDLDSAVIDSLNQYVYFGTDESTGKVVKIDVQNAQEVTIGWPIEVGESLEALVIDSSDEYIYAGSDTTPALVSKIDLQNSQEVRTGGWPISVSNSEDIETGVIDSSGQFAYFATSTSPGEVIKIDLENGNNVNTQEWPIKTTGGDIFTSQIDTCDKYAYFGSTAGQVIKVDLEKGEEIIEPLNWPRMFSPNRELRTFVSDSSGKYAYFADIAPSPNQVVKIQLDSSYSSLRNCKKTARRDWITSKKLCYNLSTRNEKKICKNLSKAKYISEITECPNKCY